ncbi:hypothetical protein KM043_013289 [Ampulex compressa]|nr:hypothetical protein KM043_013289 [Ampulex compressa]
MTSRSCTKSYSRKVSSVTPGSIQFDKLFRENSNRPSAAKSAGTVGKWGITSFTSIRSTNINGRRDDIHNTFGAKRMKLDYGNQNARVNSGKDPFSFETDPDNKADVAPQVVKPKKFFKSRNIPPVVEESHQDVAIYRQVPDSQYARKITETLDATINEIPNKEEAKPPIVLRICKGTAHLVCGSVQSTQEPEPETYRISTRLASPTKVDVDRKAFNTDVSLKPDQKTTDCGSTYSCKPAIEPLIGRDQPLPTTTQELIDILSSDADPMQTRPMIVNTNEPEESSEIVSDQVQHCSIDIPTNEVVPRLIVEAEAEQEAEPDAEIEPDPPTQTTVENDAAAAKTLVDQDWFSGSDDSEVSESQTLNLPSTNVPTKPATKKGSIFKSRSTGATNGNKRRALYKHKWCDSDKESHTTDTPNTGNTTPTTASGSHSGTDSVAYEEEFDASQLTRVVTYPEADIDFTDESDAVTSVRCGKKIKGFYTVVKNVKKAHQIQESGEFQEFNDDVEYILDTLRENNPNATRCLSAIRLASKCMAPAFRMHVRAHGTVAKFFKALHDATKDQSLGLCTATVMFVLSQDRLAMDLDRDCLELMLSLLESDASHKDALDDCGLSRAELLKNKEKVRQLCADIQAQGHAKHLNLDNITVGQLAMETLLSLTSKRAGEWFKEELRELGGLEHIVKTIRDCHRHINAQDITKSGWTDPLLDKLRKVDRCLRVLENVTHMNEENQSYLLKYDDGILVSTLASLYHLCGQEIPIYPTIDPSDKSSTGAVVRECLFAIIKVLINLTHRFNRQSFGSKLIGSQEGVLDCSLYLLLRVPDSLPEEKRFDMMMLALILLINLVEQCDDNKQILIESKAPPSTENIFDAEESGVEALIDLFYKQEELARAEEQKTDAILDGQKDSEQTETVSTTTKTQEEFIEETVTKLLQKAGRHMEHTLIGAYVVLLLGYLIMDNKDYESLVRSRLPDNNFAIMISVLQKFFNFMNLTASNEVSSCGIAATEKVIKFLKMSDARIEEEKNELPLPALEDSSLMLDLSSS